MLCILDQSKGFTRVQLQGAVGRHGQLLHHRVLGFRALPIPTGLPVVTGLLMVTGRFRTVTLFTLFTLPTRRFRTVTLFTLFTLPTGGRWALIARATIFVMPARPVMVASAIMIVLGKGDAQTRGSLDLNEFAFLIAAIHDGAKDAALGATRGGHQHIFSLKAVDLVGVSIIGAAWFAVANVLMLGLLVPRL